MVATEMEHSRFESKFTNVSELKDAVLAELRNFKFISQRLILIASHCLEMLDPGCQLSPLTTNVTLEHSLQAGVVMYEYMRYASEQIVDAVFNDLVLFTSDDAAAHDLNAADMDTKRNMVTEVLTLGAVVHDVGKADAQVAQVIEQEGIIDDQGREIMKQLPEIGLNKVHELFIQTEGGKFDVPSFCIVADVIYHHHRNNDNSGGYPNSNVPVPISAAIMKVIDSMASMMHPNKPNGQRRTTQELRQTVEELRGNPHYHQDIVNDLFRDEATCARLRELVYHITYRDLMNSG